MNIWKWLYTSTHVSGFTWGKALMGAVIVFFMYKFGEAFGRTLYYMIHR